MLITCVETAQVEPGAWLNELMERSKDMPGQLTVHVYDLFGGTHGAQGGSLVFSTAWEDACRRRTIIWRRKRTKKGENSKNRRW